MQKLVKINKPIKDYKIGQIIKLEFKNDKPISPYWQRRFEDAKIDNCLELVKEPKRKK